jgi:putative methionine-R-sulfoxide reductase with GAF domain
VSVLELKSPGCVVCSYGQKLLDAYAIERGGPGSALSFESSKPWIELPFPGQAEGRYYNPKLSALRFRLEGELNTELRDHLDSWIPFARFQASHRKLFEALDFELLELIQQRKAQGRQDSWVGFYLVAGQTLELGPFRGFQTEHHVIPIGRGLCGQAVRDRRIVNAADVKAAGDYLACSPLTRSELVVPLFDSNNRVWGEIDLDSPLPSHYSEADEVFFESWGKSVSKRVQPFLSRDFSVHI